MPTNSAQTCPWESDNCRARLNVLFPARHSLTAEENGGKFRVDLKIQLK